MMSPRSETPASKGSFIDEVRAVREAISDRAGDDFDKLGEYLREVGHKYRTKTGCFQQKASGPTASNRS
jgi:hypothetical protein